VFDKKKFSLGFHP